MKYQTNESLGPFINGWGCNFCCILEKVEVTSKRNGKYFKFSNSDVTAMYAAAIKRGYLSPEVRDDDGNPKDGCVVYDGPAIFNMCAEMFNLPVWCESMTHAEADYMPKQGEEEILELRRPRHEGSHFVSGNGVTVGFLRDEIEFDPIEGGSNSARLGYIFSKRIYKIVKREI